jgi:hypothetical protein
MYCVWYWHWHLKNKTKTSTLRLGFQHRHCRIKLYKVCAYYQAERPPTGGGILIVDPNTRQKRNQTTSNGKSKFVGSTPRLYFLLSNRKYIFRLRSEIFGGFGLLKFDVHGFESGFEKILCICVLF